MPTLGDNKRFTRTEVAMAVIRQRIALAPGARLPSIRSLAEQQKVSKSTIVEAYDRLLAEGEVEARPGSGFFAAARPRSHHPAHERIGPDGAIDPLWLMRQALASRHAVSQPGCGWLPEEWLPNDMLRRVFRSVISQENTNLTAYGLPQGFAPLREQLALRLNERDVAVDPDNILITQSATRSIDIVCRFLLRPGDTVLVDDPGYFNFRALLQAQGIHFVSIPYQNDGPDLDRFASACAEHRPKLYLTTTLLHNPTGNSLSAGAAHRLLKLAEVHDLIIVDDYISADFEAHPSPGLVSLDRFERVVLVGSFSKTLGGALRCGFIATRGDWIDGLTNLSLATSFGSDEVASQTVHRLLTNGSYRRHLDTLRPRLAQAVGFTVEHLERLGFTLWKRPEAGMFVWARLPDELDSAEVAMRALGHGMMLAPGNAFSATQTASQYLRFNAAQCTDKHVFDVLAKVLQGPGDP
jgi:DNA-binding transcriptional MocR family regulator